METPAKKKILFVITKSNWGGAQRYVYDLATTLSKEQLDVAVVLGGTGEKGGQPGTLAQKLTSVGIRIIFVQSFLRDISVGGDFSALHELVRIFKRENPDVIHLNSSKAGGVGALAARLAGVPKIIFTAHGWPFWEQRNFFNRYLIYLFSWFTALLCHKIICISRYDLEIAQKMPFVKNKTILIHNGINFSMSFGSGKVIRTAFPVGAKITGTVGELTKNKNQISLIENARWHNDMYVAIVGEGEYRTYLETKIKEYELQERVKLFGFIPASEVMKGFDIFALPSLKEGVPYVLLEARAAGLPIEHSGVGGIRDIFDANNELKEFSLERMIQKTFALYNS